MRSCITRVNRFGRASVAALLAVCLIGAVPVASAALEGPAPLPPGQPAPQFEAVTLDGTPFSLKDALRARPVAVVFWSLLCGSCREELPLLQAALPLFEAAGVQLVGMNLDQETHKAPVQKYVTKEGYTFPILLNQSGEKVFGVEEIFKVTVTPAFFLIGANGTILYSHYGPLTTEEIAAVLAKTKG